MYCKRYEEIFNICMSWSQQQKVKVLLCKVAPAGHEHYCSAQEVEWDWFPRTFFFSKLGLFEVYLQIKVNEKCSKYLIINTHKGLYRYT